MKSSYELAMERLNKVSPTVKLTEAQKREMAELEAKCAAKIAEREIFLKGEIVKAAEKGDALEMQELERQFANHRKACLADLEEKKEAVRKSGAK